MEEKNYRELDGELIYYARSFFVRMANELRIGQRFGGQLYDEEFARQLRGLVEQSRSVNNVGLGYLLFNLAWQSGKIVYGKKYKLPDELCQDYLNLPYAEAVYHCLALLDLLDAWAAKHHTTKRRWFVREWLDRLIPST